MRTLQLFFVLWALCIVVDVYQAREHGFSALGCLALASVIIKNGGWG